MVAAYVSDSLDKYITLPELAARLGIRTTGGLRTQIMRGNLKARKFGNQWVIAEDEARRYIGEQRRRSSLPTAPGFDRPLYRVDDDTAYTSIRRFNSWFVCQVTGLESGDPAKVRTWLLVPPMASEEDADATARQMAEQESESE